jgi:serine/threonine protein kinase
MVPNIKIMATEQSRLDNYIVLRTLGKGATAKVKSVQDPATNQIYAAKILRSQGEALASRFRDIMQTEMQLLNRIAHPNIVNLVNSNENGVYVKKSGRGMYNCMYMIMELCPNGELFDILYNTGKFSEPVARHYFRQILSGLEACHAVGVAHRDMKPENILFDAAFNLKLADFGFAILLSGRDGTGVLHTRLGTESYMAPELHMRRSYTGESVDLFAAGIILFIMLSQNPPFSKADPSDPYYRLLHTGDERFWAMHSRNKPAGFYSADFRSLISGMLALEPSRRLTMEQIKTHPWTAGPTLAAEDVAREVASRRQRVVEAAERAKAQRGANRGVAYNGGRYYRGDFSESEGLTLSFGIPQEDFAVKDMPQLKQIVHKYSQMATGLMPKEIMTVVSNELGMMEAECKQIGNSCAFHVSVVTETDSLAFKSNIFKTADEMYVLDFTLEEGSHFEMMKIFGRIAERLLEVQEAS